MSFTKQDIQKISHLARIKMDEVVLEKLTPDLSAIMAWIEMLSAVDTEDVEPMVSCAAHNLLWRKDVVTEKDEREGILFNASEKDDEGFFTVPKVVE